MAALVAALAALLLAGCKSDERLAWIDRITVSEAELASHPRLDLDPDSIAQTVRSALRDHGAFGLTEPGSTGKDGKDARQVRVEIVFLRTLPPVMAPAGDDESQPLRAEVGVEMVLTRRGDPRIVVDGKGQQPFLARGPAARQSAFTQALDSAIRDGVGALAMHLDIAGKSEAELVAQLQSPDGRRREMALRVLAERKSPAAIPHLIERLQQEERDEQLRALGGLVAVGDPLSVPALIDATLGADPGFLIQLVYAMGEIGGKEAEAFLFTASTGHQEDAVRAAASEALAGLRAAAASAATASTAGRPGKK